MKLRNTKTLAFALATMTILSGPVMANDMINNTAAGYVDGDVSQFNVDRGTLTLDVGSIVADDARDNQAQGHIGGSVRQDIHNGMENDLNVQVGSIKANTAYNNRARGLVAGEVRQTIGHSVADLEARVGSIEAVDGVAFNNTAEGVVDGNLFQASMNAGDVKARVGSISSK